jgi:hypothetical protein
MKIRFKGKFSPAILILVLPFLAFIALVYIAYPELLFLKGFSYGLRWQLPFSSSGQIFRQTVVRSTRDLDGKMFYAAEGDRVTVSRDIDLEDGTVYTSFWKNRFWPTNDVVWHEVLYESTTDTVTIEIEESGFYHFHFHIHKFEGKVVFQWEKNPN